MVAIEMTTYLTQAVLFLSTFSSALKWTHVIGKFGDQKIPLDFAFGDKIMEIRTHKPVGVQDTFRETENLHIFSKGIVAIKNSFDKECYIQPFKATLSGMKERVETAIQNSRNYGEIKEERVITEETEPLDSMYVKLLLGPEIAKFCNMHNVYLLGMKNSRLLHPKGFSPKRRERRFAVRRRIDGWRGSDIITDPDTGYPRWTQWPKWKDITIMC